LLSTHALGRVKNTESHIAVVRLQARLTTLLYVKRIGSMLKTALLSLVKQQLNNTVCDGHENTKCQDRIQAKTEARYQKLETER